MKNLNNRTVAKTAPKRKQKKAKDSNPSLDLVLFLENLGCSIVEPTKDFSLLDENRDTIQNPNIKNDNIVKNKMIGAIKSFPNESDPFYDIDKQSPEFRENSISLNKISNNASKIGTLVVDLESLLTKPAQN
tara:strand:- start:1874 stop:2269 length:396 start_codon:yes stop_codon:yes gene_type:complete